MADEGRRKKHDPIFSACFVVFLVACVGVLGVYVDEHYLEGDDTEAGVGNTVVVNYTGTYYAPYGEKNAVVFDTSYSSVGKNSDVLKANEFKKSSFSTLSVKITADPAQSGVLPMFMQELVGHKAGYKTIIEIPADQAYYDAPDQSFVEGTTTMTFQTVESMTSQQFKDMYPNVDLSGGKSATFKSVYGWTCTANSDVVNNRVVIYNTPEVNQTYEYIGNSEGDDDDKEVNPFGQISLQVTAVSGNTITAKLIITDTTVVDPSTGEIQMLEFTVDGQSVYITNIVGDKITYKTCDEKSNINLYFVIEIVSVS